MVDADFIIQYVTQMHHTPEDLDEGDLSDRIYRFGRYKLTKIPISLLDLDEWAYDEYKGKQMAAMPVDTMPPIVFDPINQSIIDGTHRANVRASTGDTTILAYVGVPETYYESDNDEDE